MNSDGWESLFASPLLARRIPFGMALQEAFDELKRQDAEKKKNAGLMNTLEAIKRSVASLEAQLASKGYSREA